MFAHSQYSDPASKAAGQQVAAIEAQQTNLTTYASAFEDMLADYLGEAESKAVANIVTLSAQGHHVAAQEAAKDLIYSLALKTVEA